MPPDTAEIATRRQADAKPKGGGKLRSVLDGRTRVGRRVAELRSLYASELGGWAGVSPLMRERIETAAHRRALGEHARERYLAGDDVSLDDVVRAERLGDAAERALGLDKAKAPVAPSVDAYLASRKATA